jgi:hypothetical protein
MGGTAEEKARVVEGSMAYAGPLQLPWRPCRASREAVAVPQLGRDRSAAAGRMHRGSADPQRQTTAAGRQATGAPPGLGAGRPPPRGRLTGWRPQEADNRKSIRSVSGQARVEPASPASPRPVDATSQPGLGPTAATVAHHSARTSRQGRPPPGGGSTAHRGPQPGPGLRRALTARWRTAPRSLGPRPAGRSEPEVVPGFVELEVAVPA